VCVCVCVKVKWQSEYAEERKEMATIPRMYLHKHLNLVGHGLLVAKHN
jgi:hypothetical protein